MMIRAGSTNVLRWTYLMAIVELDGGGDHVGGKVLFLAMEIYLANEMMKTSNRVSIDR